MKSIGIALLCIINIFPGYFVQVRNVSISDNIQSFSRTSVSETDLSVYFQGINGCAVIYDSSIAEYSVYNRELSEKRSSPCSTFKIITTLVGLRTNVLDSGNTLLKWNGSEYPISEWNQDLTLKHAFKASCIWYFRNVMDMVGKESIDEMLADLSYGNRDTSQWEGSGINGDFMELNGFWLESSLLISPFEQVEVLKQIFAVEAKAEISILKDIMVIDNGSDSITIFGKTGTGYKDNLCVDAWFVGFAETSDNTLYFAIRLDQPENKAVSGQKAKEIALSIIEGSY